MEGKEGIGKKEQLTSARLADSREKQSRPQLLPFAVFKEEGAESPLFWS